MLVVFLGCMIKIVELSMGRPIGGDPRPRRRVKRKYRRGKGMGEVAALKGGNMTPDSDCNSNHHGSASYLSTSSQDIDFIQDNSDYQWFLDYGYRDGGTNHHTSILSLPESYEANDLNYYEALAKNMDANLAEADMESFRTEDIHALLTNLPPMCTDHLTPETNRQGECYASVSGSMMGKFDFDSSMSPHSSSQGEDSTSMSICKSELLFSPVREMPMPGANFSVDSLDCDMMLTCQANKDNYTIAFEGSMTGYSEDSEAHGSDKSESGCVQTPKKKPFSKAVKNLHEGVGIGGSLLTQSDCGSLTTWSKLKKPTSDNNVGRRQPSGNNNNSDDDPVRLGLTDSALKSQSMPNLYKQKLKLMLLNNLVQSQSNNSSSDTCTVKRRPVKVFNIQHQGQSSSASGASVSDMATSVDATSNSDNNKQPNFNLVKLFMKQKSISTEGMSTTMDQLSSSENWPGSQSSGESNSLEPKILDQMRNLDLSHDQKSDSLSRTYDLILEEAEDEASGQHEIRHTNNNNSFERTPKKSNLKVSNDCTSKSIQTSHFSEIANLRKLGPQSQPVKLIEPSFLSKLKYEGEVEKPVYVLYPNYVLPNLDFLNDKAEDLTKVLLMPQRAPNFSSNKRRPFSCNDLEQLRKKGFNHVQDWDSLNVLLPQECKQVLADVPEVAEYIKRTPREKPSFMHNIKHRRPHSCEYGMTNVSSSSSTATQPSSGYRGSSTTLNDSQNSPLPTNTINPLFVYRYDSVSSSEASLTTSTRQRSTMAPSVPKRSQTIDVVPPRPPLPKGILTKEQKRQSMYVPTSHDLLEEAKYKRMSLPDPYFRNKRFSETEDEGVDAGTSSSSLDEHEPSRVKFPHMTIDELAQFEEFLKLSGISSCEAEDLDSGSITQLRSYVSKFLSLKMNQEEGQHFGGKKTVSFVERINMIPKHLDIKQFIAPNNSPNVSAFLQNLSPQTTPVQNQSYNIVQKWSLVNAVTSAAEEIYRHFAPATNQDELIALGDSLVSPQCAQIVLTSLCPALYALLNDGLKPNLETSFGHISNSVWQVVESSAKQGPLTKALNDLVTRINEEDVITEGLMKFNTFIFGLLNVRSLDAWTSYLRTRESILKKHYNQDSLLNLAQTGGANIRTILDKVIVALKPLAKLPFHMDLFYEYRQLHMSFKKMDALLSPTHKGHSPKWRSQKSNGSNSDSEEISAATTVHHYPNRYDDALPDILSNSGAVNVKVKTRSVVDRPRSCCESGMLSKTSFKLGEDVTSIAKKRWSGIPTNSKMYQVFDRLVREDDEEYTDSLENTQRRSSSDDNLPSLQQQPESLESNVSCENQPLNGRRFKKLQQKWEMLSGRESSDSPPSSPTHTPKSRIPRLITSPVKPSGIPVPVSPTTKQGKNVKKITTPPSGGKNVMGPVRSNSGKNISAPARKSSSGAISRTSRVDQVEADSRPVTRPSSLPYKAATTTNKTSKITPPRRAVSSSLNRKPLSINVKTPKVVKTLSHRLPSESGHLSYNEGENLKVILKVDDKWLLCCRGTQKGLVPISAVISAETRF